VKDKQTYDCIIIGSGMGGLTAALILAKHAKKVLVLEKNHQIGGALQVFSRDKCVFDTGVHYLGGLDEGENLYKLFKYLDIYDGLKLKRLDDACFDLIRFADGTVVPHGQGYDQFISNLVSAFPEEETAIRTFCAKIVDMCNYFPMYNIQLPTGDSYQENPEILAISAWDYVSSLTQNSKLRNVLLGSGPLYAGEKDATPLYVVALILNSYIKGSYRLEDGGSQIAKALVKQLRLHGGEVVKHKEVVTATYHENGHVNSVICRDGSEFFANHFISNMHPAITIDIFGKENFRPAYRERIQRLENTVSSFMVYLSFHENSFPYYNYNFYDYYTDDIWTTKSYSAENWPEILYLCTPATSKSAEFAESLCVMCYMTTDEVKEWEQTFNTIARPEERGEAYMRFKKEKEERVISRLAQQFPEIRASIRNVYSSSPLTYKDYIGTPDGSLYGIMKDYKRPEATVINSKTRVSNLHLTGQNIVFHGILGAAIGACVTCFHFVDQETLVKKINASAAKNQS
jgi:all-trans-retinol 13,14-reductase